MNENEKFTQELSTSPEDEANLAMEKAVAAMDNSQDFSEKRFDFSCQTVTFEKILKDYKNGKLKIPSFQRLYVWPKSMRRDLLDTVKVGLPFGALCVGEVDGISYLVDGRQRNTSLSLLLTDEKMLQKAEMEIKDIMEYKIVVITAHDLTFQDLLLWFKKLNSGVRLAPIVKARSNLSAPLTDAILEISRNPAITDWKEEDLSTVFRKSHHHELIAMTALLAAAGIELGDLRAKTLCQRLAENEEAVLAAKEHANALVSRLESIYQDVEPKYIKKTFTASCIMPLLYVMEEHTDIEDWKYAALINHIFQDNKPIDEWSATTRSNGNDASNVLARRDLILRLLNDKSVVPNEKHAESVEETAETDR